MAITDKKQGVWDTEEVYNKQNEGGWSYSSTGSGKALWGWGYNNFGNLGLNNKTTYKSPKQVGTDTTWASLQGSYSKNYLAIKSDGTLWSWGLNQKGMLGHNAIHPAGNLSSPTQIPGTNWRSIGNISSEAYYATKFDGTLWAWGSNTNGILGLNDNQQRSSPCQVGTDTTWNILNQGSAASSAVAAAIKTDGSMWAWGNNQYGSLGQNHRTRLSSPVQVGSETTWKSFTETNVSIAAIKGDGTLWTWGYNENGVLGLNTPFAAPGPGSRSSPTQVGTDTTWDVMFSDGTESFFARKTDGTLWSWGYNGWGQLGDLSRTSRSSPVQVLGDTGWSDTGAFGENTIATIKNDGTAWAWGDNEYGDLGQNEGANARESSPVQIGTDTNWYVRTAVDPDYMRTISGSLNSFMALRTPS